jgi:hypothetical protein
MHHELQIARISSGEEYRFSMVVVPINPHQAPNGLASSLYCPTTSCTLFSRRRRKYVFSLDSSNISTNNPNTLPLELLLQDRSRMHTAPINHPEGYSFVLLYRTDNLHMNLIPKQEEKNEKKSH